MKKEFNFYIIAPDGKIRCTAKYYCTDIEREKWFNQYKNATHETYPGSESGWMEVEEKED